MKRNYMQTVKAHVRFVYKGSSVSFTVVLGPHVVRAEQNMLDKLPSGLVNEYLDGLAKLAAIDALSKHSAFDGVQADKIEIGWESLSFVPEVKKHYVVYFTDGDIQHVLEYPSDIEYLRANRFYAFHEEGKEPSHTWYSETKNWLKE